MKVLVTGGTGLTGANTARLLQRQGHDVTIMARKPPQAASLQHFAFLAGDYRDAAFAVSALSGFDALVFAAGADIHLLPPQADADQFFMQANAIAVPQFFAKARAAGIKRAVAISSYYPLVVPEKIESDVYVRSRHLADQAILAMSDADFVVCTLNAPFILGTYPDLLVPHLQALVSYAAGRLADVPLVAPAGGVNHISALSVAEAAVAALQQGQSGKAYLMGDENLSWKTYFEWFCASAGNPCELAVTYDEHPLLPDSILYAGRNVSVHYQPDDTLPYRRGQIRSTIQDVVRFYLSHEE